MAITTTYFTGTTANDNRNEVRSWLSTNASDYFNSISIPAGSTGVQCKIGSTLALELDWGDSYGTQRMFKVISQNGTTIDSGHYYVQDYCAWRKGVKTDSGLMLCTDQTTNRQVSIIISKNNNNGVIFAVITPSDISNLSANCAAHILDFTNSNAKISTLGSNKTVPAERFKAMGILFASMTALVPIVSDAGTYCDNVFYVPFSQFTDSCFCKIEVDGTKYVYNGVFALKE